MEIKLGAQEQMLDGSDLVEKFRFAQAVGIDGIELRGLGDGVCRAKGRGAGRKASRRSHFLRVRNNGPLHW